MLPALSPWLPQNLGEMNDIAPFVCGAVVGDTMLLPGETTRLILTVDEEFCDPDNIVFSLGSMLGELEF